MQPVPARADRYRRVITLAATVVLGLIGRFAFRARMRLV